MTRRFFVGWVVLAILVVAGCSRQASDGATQTAQNEHVPNDTVRPHLTTDSTDPNKAAMPVDASPVDASPIETPETPPPSHRSTHSAQSYGLPSAPVTTIPGNEPVGSGFPMPAPTAAPPDVLLAPSATAPDSQAASPIASNAASGPQDPNYHVVEVFFGTDRERIPPASPDLHDHVRHFRSVVAVLAATLIGAGGLVLRSQFRMAVLVGGAGACLGLVLSLAANTQAVQSRHVVREDRVQYGNGRGKLEVGICRVSIPKDHQTGELESPSVLRLEFREDPERHVAILEARAFPADEFFGRLQDTVAASARREVLVFVHGYNVAFDNAVRRTAQVAYDLKFKGPAICYSWPSHGGLLQYAADENNVEWTVPHLKQFLSQIREHSGAETINLVAHSMGARGLTNALRDFARETEQTGALFHQVVLAAPDIDAEVFRRDLAPAVARIATRVTLYASSNDQALMASRKLHAYPRAGESGENLVVAPGIDTIDVSAVDTSLLGHSYYGDNDSIITDLFHLVHDALPPGHRAGLHLASYAGLPYWIFAATPKHTARPETTSSY